MMSSTYWNEYHESTYSKVNIILPKLFGSQVNHLWGSFFSSDLKYRSEREYFMYTYIYTYIYMPGLIHPSSSIHKFQKDQNKKQHKVKKSPHTLHQEAVVEKRHSF